MDTINKKGIKKEHLRRTRKLLETKLYFKNLTKGINTCAAHPGMILWTILEVDKGRTLTNKPENTKTHDDG